MPLSRRTLLATGVAAATVGAVGRAWAQHAAPDLVAFLAASARLLDAAPDGLDRDVGAKILAGLLTLGYGPGILDLADETAMTGGTVADEIVSAWMSGVVATESGPVLVAFTDARMWDALDYTKPFAFCGGETGYWSDPPAG